MDCITISTFRSLEQQAIRQHRERLSGNYHKFVSKETFGHENLIMKKLSNEPTDEKTTNEGKLNLYA